VAEKLSYGYNNTLTIQHLNEMYVFKTGSRRNAGYLTKCKDNLAYLAKSCAL
jgi:hypothetical protein